MAGEFLYSENIPYDEPADKTPKEVEAGDKVIGYSTDATEFVVFDATQMGGFTLLYVDDIADRTTKFPSPKLGHEAWHSVTTSNGLIYRYDGTAWTPVDYHVHKPISDLDVLAELVENQTATLVESSGLHWYVYRQVSTSPVVRAWDRYNSASIGFDGSTRKEGFDDLGDKSGSVAINFTTGTSDNKLINVTGNITDWSLTFGTAGDYDLYVTIGTQGFAIPKPTEVIGNWLLVDTTGLTNHIPMTWDGTNARISGVITTE